MASDLMLRLQAMGMDTEGALRRFSGNAALYERFLLKFTQTDDYEKLTQALSTEDWETLLTVAHTLKGLTGNLGLTPLFHASDQVVCALRAGHRDEARTACERLLLAYEELRPILSVESGEGLS